MSKRLNRLSPNFFWDLTCPQERFMIKISKIGLKQNSIFIKFWKFTTFFFIKSANFFRFCFTMYTKRKCTKLKEKMGAKCPNRLVYTYYIYTMLFCLFVCIKRQNGWTDPDFFLWDLTHMNPAGKVHWRVEFKNLP